MDKYDNGIPTAAQKFALVFWKKSTFLFATVLNSEMLQ